MKSADIVQVQFPFLMVRGGVKVAKQMRIPMVDAFHSGKIVHFFPEAELWHLYQGIDYLQRGAFYLAHHAYCPVMPVVHLFKSRTIFGKQLSKNITVIRSNYSTTTFRNVFDPLLLMLNKYMPGGRSEMSIDNRWLFINVNFLSKIPLCE